MILEYGGPNKSSILLSLAPKLDGLPPLHFLYVTVDGEGLPNALVEDNHTDHDLKSTLVIINHFFAVRACLVSNKSPTYKLKSEKSDLFCQTPPTYKSPLLISLNWFTLA